MATTPGEIDFPFGPHVKPDEWGDEAYVYAMEGWFAITAHPHAALEHEAKSKFKAKVHLRRTNLVTSTEVLVTLPYGFARDYLWEKKMVLTPIQYGTNIAVVVWNPEAGPAPTVGDTNAPKEMPSLPDKTPS